MINNTTAECYTPLINGYFRDPYLHDRNSPSRYLNATLELRLDGFKQEMTNFKITDDPSFDEWSENVYDPNGPKLHIWVSGRRNILVS